MKNFRKSSSLLMAGALFALVGCGSSNNNGCDSGQVMTMGGCSNGGACTVPGTAQPGGLLNGVCQAQSGAATTGQCQPNYVLASVSGTMQCCLANTGVAPGTNPSQCIPATNSPYGYTNSYGYGYGSYGYNGYPYGTTMACPANTFPTGNPAQPCH